MKYIRIALALSLVALAIGVSACGGSSKHTSSANAVANEISNNKEVQSVVSNEKSVAAKCVEKVGDPFSGKGVRSIETCALPKGETRKHDLKCLRDWFKHTVARAFLHGLPSKKDIISAVTGCVKTK